MRRQKAPCDLPIQRQYFRVTTRFIEGGLNNRNNADPRHATLMSSLSLMVVMYKNPSFSLPSSSVPAPKCLPRLSVFPRLGLFASPPGLDLRQLLIPLLLDFRRGAAQAHEEL